MAKHGSSMGGSSTGRDSEDSPTKSGQASGGGGGDQSQRSGRVFVMNTNHPTIQRLFHDRDNPGENAANVTNWPRDPRTQDRNPWIVTEAELRQRKLNADELCSQQRNGQRALAEIKV